MRALVQRVTQASVTVDEASVGAIDEGLLILVCAMAGDDAETPQRLAGKIAKLRIFRDETGRMNRSLTDVSGCALVVSQFTLAADTRRGNRPGFSAAATPELGEKAYRQFVAAMSELGISIETGVFGADMKVSLINDGPVTIWLDTDA